MEQKEYLVIGFTILKVELNRKYRLHRFSETQIQGKSDYIKSKHIFLRTNLNAGRYVIVVTTFSPNESTDFLLRLFSERNSKLTSLTKNLPVLKWYQRQTPKLLTRLTILNASDLPKQDVFRSKSNLFTMFQNYTKSLFQEVILIVLSSLKTTKSLLHLSPTLSSILIGMKLCYFIEKDLNCL